LWRKELSLLLYESFFGDFGKFKRLILGTVYPSGTITTNSDVGNAFRYLTMLLIRFMVLIDRNDKAQTPKTTAIAIDSA
jgi:hypothetical protein